MTYLPMHLWNRIAAEQILLSEWARERFAILEFADLTNTMDQEYAELKKMGFTGSPVAAFQVIFPLLLENQAISQFIIDNEYIDLRGPLPEVINIYEAVEIMKLDHYSLGIDPREAHQLRFLLRWHLIEQLGGNMDPLELAEMLEETNQRY